MLTATETVLEQDKLYELVDGQPVEKIMAGARHGRTGVELITEMNIHVRANKLGAIYGPDTTFQIGENQRMPDVAFVDAARIPPDGEPEGLWDIAPDLAVEIVSPNDDYEDVMTKMRQYLAAGVKQVWVISLKHRIVTIYAPDGISLLEETDELTGDDIIPGFRCRISELFPKPSNNQNAK